MQPQAVVDAILAKRNTGTSKDMAPLTVALGTGFYAGKDVDYVIETKRGHQPGRVIEQGSVIVTTTTHILRPGQYPTARTLAQLTPAAGKQPDRGSGHGRL